MPALYATACQTHSYVCPPFGRKGDGSTCADGNGIPNGLAVVDCADNGSACAEVFRFFVGARLRLRLRFVDRHGDKRSCEHEQVIGRMFLRTVSKHDMLTLQANVTRSLGIAARRVGRGIGGEDGVLHAVCAGDGRNCTWLNWLPASRCFT